MKKYCFVFFVGILVVAGCFVGFNKNIVLAQPEFLEEDILKEVYYEIYDESGLYLFDKPNVVVGDIIIDKNFNQYQIYFVDEVYRQAKVKLTKQLTKPFVTKKSLSQIGEINTDKKIALYMTHNDESFVIGDGYDSIYGAGGIHDIANKLASELRKKSVVVDIDETLHIPHDSYAYSRSKVTAEKLLQNNPNAIFDIHRDGAPRKNYIVYDNNQERCKVTIVVGQANPNKEVNLQFALYLMSVAQTTYPWLFGEIFFAKGHYNQALSSKALLFEVGTYLMEKSMVLETVPYLASTIYTTLFSTTVDEETGNLTIGNPALSGEKTVDEILKTPSTSTKTILVVLTVFLSGGTIAIVVWGIINKKRILFKS